MQPGTFGLLTAFVNDTHVAHGGGFEARPFPSFDAFAAEAAMYRLYVGIYFRSGNEVGLIEGQKVGRNMSALRFRCQGRRLVFKNNLAFRA